jgi:hypothetical protein
MWDQASVRERSDKIQHFLTVLLLGTLHRQVRRLLGRLVQLSRRC